MHTLSVIIRHVLHEREQPLFSEGRVNTWISLCLFPLGNNRSEPAGEPMNVVLLIASVDVFDDVFREGVY